MSPAFWHGRPRAPARAPAQSPLRSGAPGVNGVNPLPTRYAYGYAYGLRLRPTPAGLATLFDRPRGAHVKSDRQLVPPVKTERARARAPVKLSNAETALSKQQPRPGPYYPPLATSHKPDHNLHICYLRRLGRQWRSRVPGILTQRHLTPNQPDSTVRLYHVR